MAGPLHDLLPAEDEAGPDELLGRFLDYVAGQGPHPLPGAGRSGPRALRGPERHPQHPHRLGEVAGRLRAALRLARARAAVRLHLPHQGAGQREVDGPLPRARPRERRPLDRRRDRQPGGAGPVLHRRGARQHRPARGRGRPGGRRRHGRVPLVRRPGPRRGLAGAPPDPAPGPVPAHVRDARRRGVLRRGPHAPQRPADGGGEVRRAAGAARVRVLRDPARPDPREARLGEEGAGLRRALHPEGRRGQRAGLHEPQPLHPGGEERGRGRDLRLPLHEPLRPRRAQVAQAGDRRPPRRPPAEVPRARRAARPGGPAQGHLRHRHPRGGHQRPDPHRALLAPVQVRRAEDRGPLRARLPPDRRARGEEGLRRPGLRRGPGPGARDREPAARGEGEGREEGRQAEAARSTTSRTGTSRPSSG